MCKSKRVWFFTYDLADGIVKFKEISAYTSAELTYLIAEARDSMVNIEGCTAIWATYLAEKNLELAFADFMCKVEIFKKRISV